MTSVEDMTYDIVKKIDGKLDNVQRDMTDVKVEIEKTNGKIYVMDAKMDHTNECVASLRSDVENHEDDDEIHYNHGISGETSLQKAKRNAVPYGIVGTGVCSVFYMIFEVIKWLAANWPS